jgi:hypothetical protein
MFFVLKFELILIMGSNNVLTESARKVYRGRRVGQGWSRQSAHRWRLDCQPYSPAALYSPETFFLMFSVLISVRGGVKPRA